MKPDKFITIGVRFFFVRVGRFFFILSTVCVISFAHLILFSQINILVQVKLCCLIDFIATIQLVAGVHTYSINRLWCQCKWTKRKIYQWNMIYNMYESKVYPSLPLSMLCVYIFLCHCIFLSFFSMDVNANSKLIRKKPYPHDVSQIEDNCK